MKASSFRPASGVVSANYFVDRTLTPLSHLPTPILLQIPLLASSPTVQRLLEAVFSSSPSSSKQQVIANKELHCVFYNETSLSLSEEGCFVSDFSTSTIDCSCTHLTDFMAFVLKSSLFRNKSSTAPLHPSEICLKFHRTTLRLSLPLKHPLPLKQSRTLSLPLMFPILQ